MDLSLMLMTRNGGWRLDRLLRNVRDKVAEIIVGVDTASTDDTAERARRHTPHVFMIDNPLGYIEPHIETLLHKCSGEWVLRLDDDELISTNFSPAHIPSGEFDLIGFPRVWVVRAAPLHYVCTGASTRDPVPQFRLMRRSAEWRFVSQIHTPGFEMKPAHVLDDVFIYHMNLLDQSPEERRQKHDFYQRIREAPWNRTYLLDPELLYRNGTSLACLPSMCPPSELICSGPEDYP